MNKKSITPKVFIVKDLSQMIDCVASLIENKQIIINISFLDLMMKQRIIDFLSGYIYALNGKREKFEDNIYIFSLD